MDAQDSLSDSSGRFTSAYRLLRQDGFDHVVHADSIANKYFKVFFVSSRRNNGRLGIISSKRILPSSVDRNRAKRAVRETFRRHSIKARNIDVVVMVRFASTENPQKYNDNLTALLSQVMSKCAEL